MRVPCVGAIVHDEAGRLLVVERAHAPAAGRWSVPGGRVETDEDDRTAVTREVLEETGLHVTVGMRVGTVQRAGPEGVTYDIRDYACLVTAGRATLDGGVPTPIAGSDAAAARWVTRSELAELDQAGRLTDGLWAALAEWGVLPH